MRLNELNMYPGAIMTSHPAPASTPTSGPPPLKKQRSVTGGENIDPNVAAASHAPVYLRFKQRPPGADLVIRKKVKLAEVLDLKVLDKLKPLYEPEVRGQLKRCEEKLFEEMVESTYRQMDISKCIADTGYEGERVIGRLNGIRFFAATTMNCLHLGLSPPPLPHHEEHRQRR